MSDFTVIRALGDAAAEAGELPVLIRADGSVLHGTAAERQFLEDSIARDGKAKPSRRRGRSAIPSRWDASIPPKKRYGS